MTQLKVLRAILRKRKYLVLWQACYHPKFYVGRIVEQCGGEGFNLGRFAVRKQTTQADFLAQQKLSKKLGPEHWKHVSPTRQVRWAMVNKPVFWRVTPTKRRIERTESL